jgi:hypothetical protein
MNVCLTPNTVWVWIGRPRKRGSIPGTEDFPLIHKVQIGSGGPPSLLYNEYWGLLRPEVELLGRKADHSPPSTAEVKN